MVGHACPRDDRISHGEAHPLQAGRWAPAGDESAAAVLFCFCFLTAAHSLEGGKKTERTKKGGITTKAPQSEGRGKCLFGRGMPLLKRARREIRRHSRSDDCPCVLRFQKAAPGSRLTRREERAGSGLVPEPCCLARNRHASPRSRQSPSSPQFFVVNANGSPRRLFTFSSPSSSPAPLSLCLSLWLAGGVCSCARPA